MPIYPGKYKGTKEYLLVYCELINAAKKKTVIRYPEIARIMGLPLTGNYMGKELGAVLGEISQEEVSYGRPRLSALAVGKNAIQPGKGFYDLAKQMGVFKGEGAEEEMHFWEETREAVYRTWKE